MDQRQLQKTIRTLEGELKTLDLQRGTLLEALDSLRRLLPPEPTTNGRDPSSRAVTVHSQDFPGVTAGIMTVIEDAQGRPIPVGAIREAFRQRGWLQSDEGKDRSKTIYEILRRLVKAGRLERMGKKGYVLPRVRQGSLP